MLMPSVECTTESLESWLPTPLTSAGTLRESSYTLQSSLSTVGLGSVF